MSTSILEKYGENYIRNVFKTSNTVEECCNKLNTITKYVSYYAKELHCEDEYKRIKLNSYHTIVDILKEYPDAYITKGTTRVINDIPWLKLIFENKITSKKNKQYYVY